MTLTWKRDGPGRQVSTDGRFAVQSDGYTPGYLRDERDGSILGDGGEWAAILIETDENLDWFPTMREAKAECERRA